MYTLTGTDADSHAIDSATGQIKTKDALDYETTTFYTVTVGVQDNKDDNGRHRQREGRRHHSDINVSNVEEAGTVTFSSDPPRAGTALVASLSDLDGTPGNVTWQWSSAATAGGLSPTSPAPRRPRTRR